MLRNTTHLANDDRPDGETPTLNKTIVFFNTEYQLITIVLSVIILSAMVHVFRSRHSV